PGAAFDRPAGDLAGGDPLLRVVAEGDPFAAAAGGGVEPVGVDLAATISEPDFGLRLAGEGGRRGDLRPGGGEVVGLESTGGERADGAEASTLTHGVSCPGVQHTCNLGLYELIQGYTRLT